jgi:nitrate/TMAO reductase-like tetraheme cytochrome c subunit
MFKRFKSGLKRFFFPPAGSPRAARLLPYLVLGIFTLILIVTGAYGWDYANSPKFCGTTCHTMPPQNATYLASPHANIYCAECHIGRSFLGTQFARKTEDVREIYAMVFHTYEFPIMISRSRTARETCEKCHQPETFSGDSLRVITHFQDDQENTSTSIYLILKTGGGAKKEGLGKGIHWHIVNQVMFYSTDPLQQTIPYIRVYNDDSTITEYVDVESGFDPTTIDETQLKTMDCITCHNRVTHNFAQPADSVDSAMASGLISPKIPEIRKKAVEVLTASYGSQQIAMNGIAGLENYYKQYYSDFYLNNQDVINSAITELQTIYNKTVFIDQKVNWTTHPNNLGHITAPGCFRCHDGKHLNSDQEAIRLECNLCHSIPVVATSQDFVAKIEISRGPEPASHLNSNWIGLHNSIFDATCTNCHTTDNPGGTSNTSFCSNSACHGTVFTFAGFDAPNLRTILQAQLPSQPPVPTTAPVVGIPTFTANIEPIFTARCTVCHNATTAPAGLNLSTYTTVMSGSDKGSVIIPGDAVNSILVKIQSAQHFTNVTSDELALIIQWINSGALEK